MIGAMTFDADRFVHDNIKNLHAPLKKATTFGPKGRFTQRQTGERVILAPDGVTKLRVVQYVDGATAVEHGDEHRSVVIRPQPHVVKIRLHQ